MQEENKFLYDSLGKVVSMIYNGVEYYYVKNIQDDIIGLIDGNGEIIVNRNCDSCGRLRSVTGDTALGYVNPFRYRGYVADDETGLYYIGSRYYDPRGGRFVGAAQLISGVGGSLKGMNMGTQSNWISF